MVDMFDEGIKDGNSSVYETRIFDSNSNNEKILLNGESIGEFAVMDMTVKGNSKEVKLLI